MKWIFQVAYETCVGESLSLEWELRTGTAIIKQFLPMIWLDNGHWEAEVTTDIEGQFELAYSYLYKNGNTSTREALVRSWHCEDTKKTPKIIYFSDEWSSAGSIERIYATQAFDYLGNAQREISQINLSGKNHEFRLNIAYLPEGLMPCLIGSLDALGAWEYSKAIPLIETSKNLWTGSIELPLGQFIDYKYGFYDPQTQSAIRLEEGKNRWIKTHKHTEKVIISDENFQRPAEYRFRGAGVAVPIFSLRSDASCGVGEFLDLIHLGSWAHSSGLRLIQILPINDTSSNLTWQDSYPYSAISVFALHPIYLRLDALEFAPKNDLQYISEKKRLNACKEVDYEAVIALKRCVTREIFEENYQKITTSKSFKSFLKNNSDWVIDYAVFSVKRDEYETAVFENWGEWAKHQPEKVRALADTKEVQYYIWLQSELHQQLSQAVAHLHTLGIILKGDLPIGVDRNSVDVWVAPQLFHLNSLAGAPPDPFAKKGQNWGFPTYHWEEMQKDNYSWWRARFTKLSAYFDAYRIDHILGFFRIWQIPAEQVDGIMGWFDPAIPLTSEDFENDEIPFVPERYTQPFLNRDIIQEMFGEFAEPVIRDFLIHIGDDQYVLQEQFSNQQKIAQFIQKLLPGDWMNKDWIKDALMRLPCEILLHEILTESGTVYHPRISLEDTASFQALSDQEQIALRALYVDYFYSKQECFWEETAKQKLPALCNASNMLLCGEDLGMVPACVPGVMKDYGILSLEIQRWPKQSGLEFAHPNYAPYLSVVTTGTHDMSNLRAWWEEDESAKARFAWDMLGNAFPEDNMSSETASRILDQHLYAPAMWAIFPLQDILATDDILRTDNIHGERINVPAITPYYWKWRMEWNIEALQQSNPFNAKLRDMIRNSGR